MKVFIIIGGKVKLVHTLGEWLTPFQWQMLAQLVPTGLIPFAVSAYLQRPSQKTADILE